MKLNLNTYHRILDFGSALFEQSISLCAESIASFREKIMISNTISLISRWDLTLGIVLPNIFTSAWMVMHSSEILQHKHCGQTLTIEHILLECTVLQQSRDEYYTVDSLRTLFETTPEACIIEFLREAGFYYLIWMARYPTQLFIKLVTNWRHSQVELIPTTEHHH